MKRLVWWLALLLVACQPPQHWQEIVNLPTPLPRGGTLTYALDENLDVFQPWALHNRAAEVAASLTQAGLTRLDVRGQPQPELADSWQIDASGTVVTATLRADLHWSDGQNLTASDVVYTYQTLQSLDLQTPLGRELDIITNVRSASPTEVEFQLQRAYSPLLSLWALPILPEHVLTTQPLADINLRNLKVGAGPFVLATIRENGDWQLQANQQYHRGVPLFDTVELVLNQNVTALQTLMTMDQPYVIDTAQTINTKDYLATAYPQNSVLSVAFNMRDAHPLSSLPLRHELIRLAERDDHFVDSMPTMTAVHQLTLAGNWLEVPELNTNTTILDEQLAQQGWQYDEVSKHLLRNGNPLRITLIVQSDRLSHQTLALFLVDKWQHAGIEVDVRMLNRTEYLARLTAPYDYDVAIVEWAHGRSSADYADTLFYDPSAYWLFAGAELNNGMPNTYGSLNIVGMSDENYDMLANSALATYEMVGRLNAERSAAIRIGDVAPYYFVARAQRTVIRSARIAAIDELPMFTTPWYVSTLHTWYQLP